MFKRLINLQWKSFFRSASLGKSLALKILMIFFGIYMFVSVVTLSGSLFFILQKIYPEVDPIVKVCELMIYWVLGELFLRYFMQKLPVMDVKPLLMLPIKKSTITHYILGKSGLSIYNVLSLFLFIPFSIVLMVHGYPPFKVLLWLVSILGIILTINYMNFIINKSDKMFIVLGALLLGLYALEYFIILPITQYVGKLFYVLYENPLVMLVPIGLAIGSYYLNYKFLRNRIF